MGKELKGACIIGQSGGPSAVINASAYGVIKTALNTPSITKVYGAKNGITGVLEDKLYDMEKEDAKELEYLLSTPSAELGSCRYKIADPDVDSTDYERILEIFKKYDVRYFFYNGGNDSMDTCNKISRYMLKSGYECRIIGVPKTIDNDLMGTDHCPGYGSAAKYIATSFAEVSKDGSAYGGGIITIIEVMGRNAGWLTGAAALAGLIGVGPDLVYLPEVDFDEAKFLNDVERIYNKNKKCIVAVSEGVHNSNGEFIYATNSKSIDSFGHIQLGGLASYLAKISNGRTNAKVRGIELSLLQRCASHCASKADLDEAFMVGKIAVESAVAGETDKMVALDCSRENGVYTCNYKLIPLTDVANHEKKVPLEWINEEKNGVTQEFINYALPLINGEVSRPTELGLPRFARLNKVLACDC